MEKRKVSPMKTVQVEEMTLQTLSAMIEMMMANPKPTQFS